MRSITAMISSTATTMAKARGKAGAAAGTTGRTETQAKSHAKTKPLLRSSPRKRGPEKPVAPNRASGLHSGWRGREQSAFDPAALYRLMAWLSPAYPVGAFSYSGGLEWAVEAGDVADAATLRHWLAAVIGGGSAFCDAVFFVHAHRAVTAADDAALLATAELAAAFVASKERLLETTAQGRAFFDTTRAAWPCPALDRLERVWQGPLALPVAVATACAGHGIGCELALPAFLHALAANLVSAGIRLVPLGQTDGQRVLAALEETVLATAARAQKTPLDEVGSAVWRADIASMSHEIQYTRLFRS